MAPGLLCRVAEQPASRLLPRQHLKYIILHIKHVLLTCRLYTHYFDSKDNNYIYNINDLTQCHQQDMVPPTKSSWLLYRKCCLSNIRSSHKCIVCTGIILLKNGLKSPLQHKCFRTLSSTNPLTQLHVTGAVWSIPMPCIGTDYTIKQ